MQVLERPCFISNNPKQLIQKAELPGGTEDVCLPRCAPETCPWDLAVPPGQCTFEKPALSLHLQGCAKVKASLCSPCTGASIKTPFCYGRKPALGSSHVCILQPSSPHEKSSLLMDRPWITSYTKNIHHAISEQSPNHSTIKHKLILYEYEIQIQQEQWSKSKIWAFLQPFLNVQNC